MPNGTSTCGKRIFLDVEKYPEATFESTKYNGDASGGELEGILTLHGVSKPITIDMKYLGEGDDPWGGYRAGFEGHVTIRRADFGMTYELGPQVRDDGFGPVYRRRQEITKQQ